jgi:hypothetical protein
MLSSNAWLVVAGAAFIVVGLFLRRWSARHDLKDAAIDSAWSIARGRRTADNPTAIEAKFRDIQAQTTWTGKATRTAGTALAHVLAQVAAVAALILILVGLALAAAGSFWR